MASSHLFLLVLHLVLKCHQVVWKQGDTRGGRWWFGTVEEKDATLGVYSGERAQQWGESRVEPRDLTRSPRVWAGVGDLVGWLVFPAFLRCEWHVTVCTFTVYSVMLWYVSVLQNDDSAGFVTPLPPSHTVSVFVHVVIVFKIHSSSSSQVCSTGASELPWS